MTLAQLDELAAASVASSIVMEGLQAASEALAESTPLDEQAASSKEVYGVGEAVDAVAIAGVVYVAQLDR